MKLEASEKLGLILDIDAGMPELTPWMKHHSMLRKGRSYDLNGNAQNELLQGDVSTCGIRCTHPEKTRGINRIRERHAGEFFIGSA